MMFEEYADILSPSEAAEALRIGENALYELLNTVSYTHLTLPTSNHV